MNTSSDTISTQRLRLNPFAFPSPTAILFFLIITFAFHFLMNLSSVLSSSMIPTWLLRLLFLIILQTPVILIALRSFFNDPERTIRRYAMEDLRLHAPKAADLVTRLSKEIGLKTCPQLLWTAQEGISAFAFGTFNRHYIVFSDEILARDQQELEAIAIHELAHFRNGDVWLTGLAQKFSRTFLIGMLLYISLGAPNMWANRELLQRTAENILLGTVGTFLFISVALLLFLSINHLLRLRELYADARTRLVLQDTAPLTKAIISTAVSLPLFSLAPAGPAFMRNWRLGRWYERLRSAHPSVLSRLHSLSNDSVLLKQSLPVVVVAGFTASSFGVGLSRVGIWVFLLLAPLLGFCVISASLLPWLCIQRSTRTIYGRLLRYIGTYIICATLPVGLLSVPWVLMGSSSVADSFASLARLVGTVGAMQLIILSSWLPVHTWLQRKMLSLYGFPLLRSPWLGLIALPGIASLGLILFSVVVLAIVAGLILDLAPSLLETVCLAFYMPFLMLLGGGWLWLRKRYSRCPHCEQVVQQQYIAGLTCSSCGHTLDVFMMTDVP